MGIVAKNDGNSCRAGFGGGRIVKLGSIPSLDRFQAQAIWEMSDESHLGELRCLKMMIFVRLLRN